MSEASDETGRRATAKRNQLERIRLTVLRYKAYERDPERLAAWEKSVEHSKTYSRVMDMRTGLYVEREGEV